MSEKESNRSPSPRDDGSPRLGTARSTLSKTGKHCVSMPEKSFRSTFQTDKGPEWGIKGYYVPKTMTSRDKDPQWKFGSKKRDNLYSTVTTPGPDYNLGQDWTKMKRSGKFLKGPRDSELDKIVRDSKSHRCSPGVGSYNVGGTLMKHTYGSGAPRGERVNFLSEVEYLSSSLPSPNRYSLSTQSLWDKKCLKWKRPEKIDPLKKTNKPGPGQYDYLKSFNKFSRTEPRALFSKETKGFASIPRNHTTLSTPGVGSYNVDKKFKISKGPKKR
eukprot:CAMPEP_0114997182 /NCGR_PEP_ID=MMETSP0216-20121206/14754_1 /TAXON_ID=223996 /ORGANISM="Protocruzia adherens, Strain Boccale" /LENGTH=271 /DNA_ID=CAMNT_0002361529 /DNA_START=66 /DNA_END=881 /DNA_ORIENTATION=-